MVAQVGDCREVVVLPVVVCLHAQLVDAPSHVPGLVAGALLLLLEQHPERAQLFVDIRA